MIYENSCCMCYMGMQALQTVSLGSSLCENEFDVKVHLDLHLNLM